MLARSLRPLSHFSFQIVTSSYLRQGLARAEPIDQPHRHHRGEVDDGQSVMTSVFDGCDDSCGWTAAVVAALAYGSFGVPIKETTRLQRPLQVHPLVLQSYKTLTMFVLSWLVLPLLGVVPSFTPWGVLSGTLWVLGGTAGIYAIRKAGMAIAVGTWASIMIAVNFVWGILVFREPVHDMAGVALAFLLLAVGLVGMSYFAAPSASRENEEEDEEEGSSSSSLEAASDPTSSPPSSPDASPSSSFLELSAHDRRPSMLQVSNSRIHSQFMHRPSGQSLTTNESKHLSSEDVTLPSKPYRVLVDEYYESDDDRRLLSSQPRVPVLCHRVYSRFSERTLGIFGAVFNGLMTGSSLLPLHFAKHHGYGGANYMISFACGSLVANAGVWMVYAAYLVYSLPGHDVISAAATASRPSPLLTQAWSSLPPWHLRELGGPGCAAGALLTVAMFGSILSVTYLGQGIGNSVIQSKILISGLWGIFWYKEISGGTTIAGWFASASVAVAGILWLSQERLAVSSSSRALGSDGAASPHRLLEWSVYGTPWDA